MKIIHIVNGNDVGGAMTQILSLVNSQRKRHEVCCLSVGEGLICEESKKLGIDVEVFSADIMGLNRLASKIKKMNKVDSIFHFHGLKPMIAYVICSYKCKINNITTIHSDFYEEYVKKTLKNLVAINIFKFAIKRISNFITVSEKFENLLYDLGVSKNRVTFIPNGINIDNIEVDKEKEVFLNEKNVPFKGKVILGIAARLHPVKGIDFLIEISNYLKDTNIIVLVAGIGEINYVDSLKEKANSYGLDNTLYFIGYVEDIYNFYNAIDINLLTSIEEGVSYSVMEGAFLSKPIISTDVSGMKTLIEDGQDGIIVKQRDPEKFAKKIIKLSQDSNLRIKLGTNLKNKVVNNYTNEKMAKKYEMVYKKILGVE